MKKQELPEGEKKFLRLIQHMPAAVYTTDQEGVLTFYNQKAIELWGYRPRLNDPEEKRYSGSSMIFKTDGTPLPHNKCPMAVALQQQKKIIGEEIIIERPDGSRVKVLANISPLFENDEFSGALNVLQDITVHKSIEKDAWRLAAIVESSDDAIISKTLNGIITSWNQGAEKMFGYAEEEMLGRAITTIIPPERWEEEEMILNRVRNGKKVDHFETLRVTKSGSYIPVSVAVSPIKDSRGRITGASKIARDISVQVHNRNQMQQLNQKLQEANKSKDKFMGMASHELKTPITVIKNNLQLLHSQIKDGDLEPLVFKALDNVEKLTLLISDMLDITKVEEDKLSLNYNEFDLNKLMRTSIEYLQPMNTSHQIIFKEQSDRIIVNADKQRIEQVIVNLLSNAIKYSPDADKVIAHVRPGNDEVIVSVQDFGIGIPGDQIKKVFTRFFRAKNLAPAFSGLGIGLYISKDIVERHQGEIWVESKEGKGSTFYFKIPRNV